jgi:hypothetical protein
VTFKETPTGSQSEPIPVSVVATGPVTIQSIAVTGDTKDFAFDPDCIQRELAARERCDIQVRFQPQVDGFRSGVLEITTSDGTIYPVKLEGTGFTIIF